MDKLKYVKPTVLIEHYAFTQAISSCAIGVGSMDTMRVLKDPDPSVKIKNLVLTEGYFMEDVGCANEPLDGGEDGLCYHTASNALLVS